jgi:oxaloacetate decarboxylase gamma subunit
MENMETALLLLVVGMGTVFAILLLLIYLGKFLIALVNKYAPEEEVAEISYGELLKGLDP